MLNKRNKMKKNNNLSEKDEEELFILEKNIANECEEQNRRKGMENLNDLDGNNGNLNNQGVLKAKRKGFAKVKPTLPVGKKGEMPHFRFR